MTNIVLVFSNNSATVQIDSLEAVKLKNKASSKSATRIIPEYELGSTAPNHVIDCDTSARNEFLSDCLELFIKEKEVKVITVILL